MSDKNKCAVITGASSGIGLECAKILAAKGYTLVVVARRDDRLKKLADEIEASGKTRVHILVKDLSKSEAPQEIFDYTMQQGMQVEVLVNNAGFGLYGEFINHSSEDINRMLNVNVVALTNLTHLFA